MEKSNKRVNKIKFEPKLKYYEIEYLVGHTTFGEKEIKNDQVYNLVKKLALEQDSMMFLLGF